MKIHILGICGTFMGSLAIIAKQLGHEVSGSDEHVYPPMSTQLEQQGIKLFHGYTADNLADKPDLIVIGNTMKRGTPVIEYILNEKLPYISGPEWLAKNVLQNRWVLAVSGTHGKTTTSGMLTWIFYYLDKKPGYLIGGVPKNLPASADLGQDPFFIIEADEYDTAFFDKRSKFIHYQPRTLIINNIEFDHGDIFRDLDAIKQQFAHLIKIMPGNGLIIHPEKNVNVDETLKFGVWTPITTFGDTNSWHAQNISPSTDSFDVYYQEKICGRVNWSLLGIHNINNALAAIAAAQHANISPSDAIAALSKYTGIQRRLDVFGQKDGITVYDDFAHHPTAIAATIAALRAKVGKERIIAIMEFASNTMRAGLHGDKAIDALNGADYAFILRPNVTWDINALVAKSKIPTKLLDSVDAIVQKVKSIAKPKDHILVMSNKDFDGLKAKLLQS